MKKKMITLALSLVMCLGMGTSVLAAPSPTYQTITPTKDTLEKENLSPDEYRILSDKFGDWYTDDGNFATSILNKEDAASVKRNEKAKQVVREYAGITGYDRVDVIAGMNLSASDVTNIMWSVGRDVLLIDITTSPVKYDKYLVLHITRRGFVEVIPVKIVGGKLIGTFHSLSPVIIFGIKDEGSGTTTVPSETTATATNSSGAAIELEVSTENVLAGANAEEIKAYNSLLYTIQNEEGKAISRYSQVCFSRINWYGDVNISLRDGVDMPKGGIDITIYDPRIKKNATMILLQIKSDGTIAEIRNLKVTDGAITAHVDSLSIFVYLEVVPKACAGNSSASLGSGTAFAQPSISPKTGEQDTAAPLYLAGMMVVCGAAYFSRKRFHV